MSFMSEICRKYQLWQEPPGYGNEHIPWRDIMNTGVDVS